MFRKLLRKACLNTSRSDPGVKSQFSAIANSFGPDGWKPLKHGSDEEQIQVLPWSKKFRNSDEEPVCPSTRRPRTVPDHAE